MALHKDKFEYMSHTSNKHSRHSDLSELPFMCQHFQYNVADDITLQPVHQLRNIGILSWSPHIRAIASKASQKASWVLSVFHTRTASVMLTLYKSMVRSLLEYSCPLWHPIRINDIQELESIHSKNLRDKRHALLGPLSPLVPYVSTATLRTLHHSPHVENPTWLHQQRHQRSICDSSTSRQHCCNPIQMQIQ